MNPQNHRPRAPSPTALRALCAVLRALRALCVLLATATLLTSCSEIKTTNPDETYKHWAGTNPPADIQLLKAQYWQSPHFTKEYIMYLELKPTEVWWNEFLKQNNIVQDNAQWTIPAGAPSWFQPSGTFVRYRTKSGHDQGSRYFRDATTGICYIYETQL